HWAAQGGGASPPRPGLFGGAGGTGELRDRGGRRDLLGVEAPLRVRPRQLALLPGSRGSRVDIGAGAPGGRADLRADPRRAAHDAVRGGHPLSPASSSRGGGGAVRSLLAPALRLLGRVAARLDLPRLEVTLRSRAAGRGG